MKYFLTRDESGDWYLVEVAKRREWRDWNWRDKEIPDFAQAIDNPSNIEFEFDLNTLK